MVDDVFGIVGSTQAGAFEVDGVVAEGGFAVVYTAQHTGFRARVALKCLKVPDGLDGEQQREFLQRFREEGELLFRLSSVVPSVVRPLHVGTIETEHARFVPFIALEWLDGETLDALIRRRQAQGDPPLTLKEALRLLAPVATALSTAHQFPDEHGVICILHRDLKPENVFVVQNGPAQVSKILDFGIGKVKSATTQLIGRQSAEASSLVAFTPGYGSPEQWVPKRYGQTGPWTDVWGFALTLVETLTARTPIDGDHAAMLGTAIDPERRPTPRNQGAAVSDEAERVFERALAVDPKDRYNNMTQLWDDLCAAAGIDRAGHSMPPGPSYPAAFGGATVAAPAAPRSAEPPPELDLALPAPAPRRSARSPQNSASRIDDSPHWLGGDDMFELESMATSASSLAMGSGAELEGVGLTPRAAPVRPRAEHVAIVRPEASPLASVGERLRGPVTLVLVGVAIAAADFVYTTTTGELFRVASLRPLWLAGPLVVLGVTLGVSRLFR